MAAGEKFLAKQRRREIPGLEPAQHVRLIARRSTDMAIRTLQGIAASGSSESARVAAALALLERGWGKAPVDAGDGEGITIVIRRILEGPGIVEASATNPKPNGSGDVVEGEVLEPSERGG